MEVNLFFAFYILGLVPGFLVAGPLSDAHGRKRLVTVALALGVVGSAILAFGGGYAALMCAGRFVCGVSVAVAMVVGTSWIKELSQHDADPATRARRASLTLTFGFGVGAGVSGALAQWGPAPTLLPYAVQVGLSLLAVGPLLRTPETRTERGRAAGPLLADLRLPAAGRSRFLGVVLPMAPWVFGAPALAFVVGPALVAEQVGQERIAFAALASVVTLAFGAGVQPFVPLITRRTGGRPGVAGLAVVVLGTALLAVDAVVRSPGLTLVAAALFGLGYGTCIVAGLVEVQAMAPPERLAGLTGLYYSLTYVGFVLPVLLAELARFAAYPVLLTGVAVLALACALVLTIRISREPARS